MISLSVQMIIVWRYPSAMENMNMLKIRSQKTDMLGEIRGNIYYQNIRFFIDKLDLDNELVIDFLMDIESIRRFSERMNLEKSSLDSPLFNISTVSLQNIHDPNLHEILAYSVQQLQSVFKSLYPNGSSQLLFLNTPTLHEESAKETGLDYVHPKEFATEFCGNDVLCAEGAAPVTTKTTSRYWQFSYWLTLAAIIILLWYVYNVMNMNYETDR
eukprot:UN06567